MSSWTHRCPLTSLISHLVVLLRCGLTMNLCFLRLLVHYYLLLKELEFFMFDCLICLYLQQQRHKGSDAGVTKPSCGKSDVSLSRSHSDSYKRIKNATGDRLRFTASTDEIQKLTVSILRMLLLPVFMHARMRVHDWVIVVFLFSFSLSFFICINIIKL